MSDPLTRDEGERRTKFAFDVWWKQRKKVLREHPKQAVFEAWMHQHGYYSKIHLDLLEKHKQALAECERLRKDVERIEWLGTGNRGYHIVQWLKPDTELADIKNVDACTPNHLREAIDQALSTTAKDKT